jgi:hypothetical protein
VYGSTGKAKQHILSMVCGKTPKNQSLIHCEAGSAFLKIDYCLTLLDLLKGHKYIAK